jgi:hypothetical protein
LTKVFRCLESDDIFHLFPIIPHLYELLPHSHRLHPDHHHLSRLAAHTPENFQDQKQETSQAAQDPSPQKMETQIAEGLPRLQVWHHFDCSET